MYKKLLILIIIAVFLIVGILILKSQFVGEKIIQNLSDNGRWLFPLVTAGALVDSLNLCAVTILILTIGFLFSLGQFHPAILKIGTAFILGIFLVYVLIGLGILRVLYLFNTPNFMAKIGALILIIFGIITLINEFFPAFPVKLKIPKAAHEKIAKLMTKSSFPGAFMLGLFVGLCAFPCTGGPYLMVLGLLHDKATHLKGFLYLLYYNLLFVLPLVIILLIAGNKNLLEKIQGWREEKGKGIKLIFGLAMILLGAIILIL